MTAEQLNIKMNLDIGDLLADVKKVKTQLKGMADSVKGSIPKISSEGKNAKSALSGVAKAGNEVQRSLDRIGDEARDSLGDVVTRSNKITQAFRNLKSSSNGLSLNTGESSESIKQTESSLEGLKDMMQSIVSLNFVGLIANNFEGLKKTAKIVKDSFGNAVKDVKKGVKNLKDAFSFSRKEFEDAWDMKPTLGDMLYNFKYYSKQSIKCFKGMFKEIGAIVASTSRLLMKLGIAMAGAIAMVGASIGKNTREYREAQSKLVSSFQSSGATAEQASQAYNNLFRFLGQSDQAVEAANHLAKLTNNTQHLAEWTTICQGIYATFGASLNVEGLTEAANETARTGKVTGTLADALNWAGVSEDAMNAALEKTTTLSEREALIRQTLNGLYQDAAKLYEQNNKEIIKQNEAQAKLDATMAKIGQQTQVLVTSWINFKNTLMTAVAPAIVYVSAVFSVLLDKLSQLIQWFGALFGISFSADNITGIVDGIGSGIDGVAGSVGGLEDSLNSATGAAEKLKRTTMGFDELNIVTDPNSSSGGASADTGASAVTGLQTGRSIMSQMGEQIELIKSKVSEFFDKWKDQIAIIGGALATLGVAKLLEGLGKAIGLGDKFLSLMGTIKKLAATTITIVLQYTLMSEFLKNYIDGEGFKEYLKAALVAAIGTGILYSMWGPAGLVIGLGVTAVAALKTVFDNGGITNLESAVVALTGLAAAIGAVGIAWSKLGLKDALAKIGTALVGGVEFIKGYIAAVKVAASEVGLFAAMFPKLSSAIAGIGTTIASATTAVSGFLGSIGAVFGLSGGAAIAAGAAVIAAAISAVVSVIVFLKRNWEELGVVIKNFFNTNIIPKFEAIKKSIMDAGKALGSLIPDGLKKLLKDIWQGIKDVVDAIGDWFASIKWIEKIGDVFEVVGGIIVGVVSGAIAGAINGFVSLLQGVIEFVSGIVQIVSGIVKAIVSLLSGDLKKAGEAVKNIADGIVSCFKGLYDATLGIVVEFVKGIINWFTELWDVLVGHSIVPDMVKAIIEWFFKLPKEIFAMMADFVKKVVQQFTDLAKKAIEKFKEIVNNIKQAWTNVKNTWDVAGTYFSNIWTKIKNVFSNTATWFRDIFQTAWNNIKNIFNNVSTYFTNIWNTIKKIFSNVGTTIAEGISGAVKSAINAVLRTVTNKINNFIDMINGAIRIINKIPGVSLSTVSKLSIPQLATGGIVTSETLARIGERGKKEAVLPLEQNTGWMDMLADKIASRGNSEQVVPAKIILQVDGRQLGMAAIDNINAITKQKGGLQLHIV